MTNLWREPAFANVASLRKGRGNNGKEKWRGAKDLGLVYRLRVGGLSVAIGGTITIFSSEHLSDGYGAEMAWGHLDNQDKRYGTEAYPRRAQSPQTYFLLHYYYFPSFLRTLGTSASWVRCANRTSSYRYSWYKGRGSQETSSSVAG